MIRRDHQDVDGQQHWILISQREHARLAGDFARYWGDPSWRAISPDGIILPMIYHHDDGWADWDDHPRLDSVSHAPIAFTEMPIADAHAIWKRSIDAVAALGPLAQYAVASHFLNLRKGGSGSATADGAAFIQQYSAQAEGWLQAWQQHAGETHGLAIAQRAVTALQLFDALSLWLCVTDGRQPHRLVGLDGTHVCLTCVAPRTIHCEPWPFMRRDLSVTVTAWQVPVRHYASSQELCAQSREATGYYTCVQ